MPESSRVDLSHVCFEGKRPVGTARRASPLAPQLSTPAAIPHRLAAVQEESLQAGFAPRLLEAAGIDPTLYRARPLQRRLAACLRALKVTSEEDALRLLDTRPDLVGPALDALLIGVTEFFRDPSVFEQLRRDVVPALAARGGPLRAWSAGCSNGAELYSLAILLAEAGLLRGADLLGTDCRREALEEARRALYPASALGAVPASLRASCFEPAGRAWRPVAALREAVRWDTRDLGQGLEAGPWDLILCRNVTIYLEPPRAALLTANLVGALRHGGYLVVGKAERPPAGLGLEPLGRCIYRRRPNLA